MLADNGVIHFISDVIYPPVSEDIPAKLASDGRFGTLLTAVEMAGLGELLTESKQQHYNQSFWLDCERPSFLNAAIFALAFSRWTLHGFCTH